MLGINKMRATIAIIVTMMMSVNEEMGSASHGEIDCEKDGDNVSSEDVGCCATFAALLNYIASPFTTALAPLTAWPFPNTFRKQCLALHCIALLRIAVHGGALFSSLLQNTAAVCCVVLWHYLRRAKPFLAVTYHIMRYKA